MKKTIIGMILIGTSFCCGSCYDEDKLIPTERPEFGYLLPQGKHDYDDRIVEWKERGNFFTLYKFLPRDIYWSVTGWIEGKPIEKPTTTITWKDGIRGEGADENFVGQQLDLLENLFLNFYPDSTLTRCMPLKVLLCDSLFTVYNDGTHILKDVHFGFDFIAIDRGRADIETMIIAQRNAFKKTINTGFFARLLSEGKILQTIEFFKGTDYVTNIPSADRWKRGFLNTTKTQAKDWESYIEAIVTTSYADLTTETAANKYNFLGILHPTKDVNGLIRYKYGVIIEHFKKQYGIDLQAIGNATEK